MRLCGARSRLRGDYRHTTDATTIETLRVHRPSHLPFARIPFKEGSEVPRCLFARQMVDFTYWPCCRFFGHGVPLGLSRIAPLSGLPAGEAGEATKSKIDGSGAAAAGRK